ncbi:MAG: FFLEELY motif protein [Gammaproteobacteria bacterium]
MSVRQEAAQRFRDNIRRSNELHASYLQDPALLRAYDRFANWQLEYLLPFFADIYDEPGYAEALDFTMSDLAGVGISRRDKDLERAAPAITRMLPRRALQTIATAAEMNARVLQLNISICRNLMRDGELPEPIKNYDYWVACRAASTLDECAELVHVITRLGDTLSSLVEVPMIGMTLRAMRGPAHAAGFGALQEFLETGYTTFRAIPDIQYFLKLIETRMIAVFEQIFCAPLDDACVV